LPKLKAPANWLANLSLKDLELAAECEQYLVAPEGASEKEGEAAPYFTHAEDPILRTPILRWEMAPLVAELKAALKVMDSRLNEVTL
jgi:hypothetical protein